MYKYIDLNSSVLRALIIDRLIITHNISRSDIFKIQDSITKIIDACDHVVNTHLNKLIEQENNSEERN